MEDDSFINKFGEPTDFYHLNKKYNNQKTNWKNLNDIANEIIETFGFAFADLLNTSSLLKYRINLPSVHQTYCNLFAVKNADKHKMEIGNLLMNSSPYFVYPSIVGKINITVRSLHKEILIKAEATTLEGKNGLVGSFRFSNPTQYTKLRNTLFVRYGALMNIIKSKEVPITQLSNNGSLDP